MSGGVSAARRVVSTDPSMRTSCLYESYTGVIPPSFQLFSDLSDLARPRYGAYGPGARSFSHAATYHLRGLRVENGVVVNGVANPRSRLAILAVIATTGDHGIRREKLLALLWPESDEERARQALRQALFTMRRDMGAAELTIGVSDLRLNPNVLTSDVGDFRAAIEERRFDDAVALYRGPFLDGVFVRDSAEFEHWLDGQLTRLE